MIYLRGHNQGSIKIGVIGVTTAKFAAGHSLRIDIIPDSSTAENLAEAIKEYFNKEK